MFHNNLDATAQRLVALFQNPRVLLHGDNRICITNHVQQRDASFCQRREVIDRTAAVSERIVHVVKAECPHYHFPSCRIRLTIVQSQ